MTHTLQKLAVVSYPHITGKNHIHLFATGSNAHLYRLESKDGGETWADEWEDHGPPTDEQGHQTEASLVGLGVTKLEDTERLYTFVSASDGHLWVLYSKNNGADWAWRDQGAPSASAIGPPAVVSYREGGQPRVYAFVVGAMNIHVNFWDVAANKWRWAESDELPDHPESAAIGPFPDTRGYPTTLGAVAFNDHGVHKIYVFVPCFWGGDFYVVYTFYWDGTKWSWLATTSNARGFGSSAITYEDALGKRHIYNFIPGRFLPYKFFPTEETGDKEGDQLSITYTKDGGANWSWAEEGQAAKGVDVGPPAAVTFKHATKQRIYAFVIGTDGNLHVHFWNGDSWAWANQGHPGAGTISNQTPAATAYIHHGLGVPHIHAFVVAGDGKEGSQVWQNYWNGSRWQWQRLGTPFLPAADSSPL